MATCEVKPGEGDHSYQLCFDVPGSAVVRAAWLERNNRIARGEREGEISEFDWKVALCSPDQPLTILFNTPTTVVTELQAFGQNTASVVSELAGSGGPDYENERPSKRTKLGAGALLLTAQIEDQFPRVEEIVGLNTALALDLGPDTHALAVHLDSGQAA